MEESRETSRERSTDTQVLLGSIARTTEQLARASGSGGDLLGALGAARELRRLADEAVTALVAEARRQGASWQAIGAALGVSRQAAFERYRASLEEAPCAPEAARARARALLGCFLERRFGELRDLCDDRVRAGLGEPMLASLRDGLEGLLGDPATLEGSESWSEDRYQVVDTRVAFARGVRTMRVTVDPRGLVAGFFILEPPSGE